MSISDITGGNPPAGTAGAGEAEVVPEARQPLFDRLEGILTGLFAAAALLLCCLNILLRSLAPDYAIEWGDEVQVYLVIWAVCLSFGAVTASGRHIKADFFVERLPPGLNRAAAVLSDVLGLFMAALLVWYGAAVVLDAYDFGDLSTTSLRFPLWIYYLALPVGAALMALRYLIRLLHAAFGRARGET